MDLHMILFYAILIIAAALFIARAIEFFKYPRSKQIECFKEWLVYAVSLAEKELGSGIGALKLRQVYDNFATKFPHLVEFISFEKFCNYVDEALISMRKMLESNKDISVYINGDKTARFRRRGKSCVNSIKTGLLGENYGRNNFYQGGFST